tara:strand:+ start:3018 stop:4037 length:1020 start_codon:yes stop_codon:yes gene_type:complete
MTFFNKKTDVIDIELTPYGRYLLSIGRLKPKYYDFSDDDILYDVSADGASSESPEQAHSRIMTNTPKLKTLYLKKGIESDAQENYSSPEQMNIETKNIRITSQEVSYNQKAINPMGRSSYESKVVPSFQMTMLQGEITSSIGYLSSSLTQLPIPQIDIDFVVTATTASALSNPIDNHEFVSLLDVNNKYVYLQFTNPIIHLKEFGSFYEKENFDIEVFEISNYKYKFQGTIPPASSIHKALSPKKFNRRPTSIINDMLVELPSETYQDLISSIRKDKVEYYFNIEVDSEIPNEELCKAVGTMEINSQFLDEEIICPDTRTEQFNIYSSRVTPDDLEDCD